MNCQEFWDHLPQRGQGLTEAQAAHLDACANCTSQWVPQKSLSAGLHSLAEEWRQTEAPARVEAGLMAAYRAQVGVQAQRRSERSWWTPVFTWAAAAAATIALATVLVRGYQPATVKPGSVASPHRSAPSAILMASLDTDSDNDANVLGEGFVHLPNTPRVDPNEDYNVVRVELPGSAVIDAGISLSEDRAADTVLADVALAADGTPRAVRLVPEGGSN